MDNVDSKVIDLVNQCEVEVLDQFKKVDAISDEVSLRVFNAFRKEQVAEVDFQMTTGYGYNDVGRDKIERIFSDVLGAEDALVRNQFISGTHALTVALFALLRPGDALLSITGTPYDTLHEVIGIKENSSSLKTFGIGYDQIDLVDNDFDYEKIGNYLKSHKVKVIEIQRSKGYSTRKSVSLEKIEKVIQFIKNIDSQVIIFVDNCYCEFVSVKSPLEVGADIIVGSLIKNLGAGIALNGAYIAGKKDLIHLASERLNVPGEAKEVGPSLGANRTILQGLYMAPSVVSSSLKTAILTSKVLETLGYEVEPKFDEERVDIVQNIVFGNSADLIKYCGGIQMGSPVDSYSKPIPWDMPGYDDQVIMASGSFVQGSSIEISCDAPIREPYIAYQQGGLAYSYGKLALILAVNELLKKD